MERGLVPSSLQSISVFDSIRPQVLPKPARNSDEDSPISKMAGGFSEEKKGKPSGLRPRRFRSKLKLY